MTVTPACFTLIPSFYYARALKTLVVAVLLWLGAIVPNQATASADPKRLHVLNRLATSTCTGLTPFPDRQKHEI